MKLEKTFENEIKKISDGTVNEYNLLKEFREVAAMLDKRYEFENCMKQYGRAKVSLILATTITRMEHRFETPEILWAQAVYGIWFGNRTARAMPEITNLHPAIIHGHVKTLRKYTEVTA